MSWKQCSLEVPKIQLMNRKGRLEDTKGAKVLSMKGIRRRINVARKFLL